MRKPKRSTINGAIWLIAASLLGLLAVPLLMAVRILTLDFSTIGLGTVLVLVLVAMGGVGLAILSQEVNNHLDEVERLRGDVVMIGGTTTELPRRWSEEARADDELKRLAGTISDMLGRERAQRTRPDARLEAVVGAVADGLVVVTDSGLVSLINHAASVLLGRTRAGVGTSVYAALEREDVIAAMARARAARHPASAMIRTVDGDYLAARVADLGQHGGTAISFHATVLETSTGLSYDLGLLDRLPAKKPVDDDTPLIDLPVVVLDTETTGLNVRSDRIVSVGAVRVHGSRIFHSANMDRLVNPGLLIPARSTAIHGITNQMVGGAPAFPEIAGEIEDFVRDTVVVGHNIRFDLAMLKRETERAGLPWSPPRSLDTSLLVIALEPNTENLNLESVAERFGVEIQGRHTALGDCLVTAEIYVRMVPRLHDHGISTLGQAIRFQTKAKEIIGLQEESGWL